MTDQSNHEDFFVSLVLSYRAWLDASTMCYSFLEVLLYREIVENIGLYKFDRYFQ